MDECAFSPFCPSSLLFTRRVTSFRLMNDDDTGLQDSVLERMLLALRDRIPLKLAQEGPGKAKGREKTQVDVFRGGQSRPLSLSLRALAPHRTDGSSARARTQPTTKWLFSSEERQINMSSSSRYTPPLPLNGTIHIQVLIPPSPHSLNTMQHKHFYERPPPETPATAVSSGNARSRPAASKRARSVAVARESANNDDNNDDDSPRASKRLASGPLFAPPDGEEAADDDEVVFVKDEPVDEDDLLSGGTRQEQSKQQPQQAAEDLGEIKLEDDGGGAAVGDVKPELKVTCESD